MGGTQAGAVRALVVDDDEFVRNLVLRQLARAGAEAVGAADWRAARVLLERHPECNLVVSDLDMPGAEGSAFLDELAALRPGIALIIASALQPLVLRQAEKRARALPLNVLGCLPKPTSADTLRGLIEGLGRS
jgi:DNA-binding NtrC family response regulator